MYAKRLQTLQLFRVDGSIYILYDIIIMIMALTMMMTIPDPFTNHDDNDDMMMTMVIIVDPCTPHPPPANRPGRPTKQHCAGSQEWNQE